MAYALMADDIRQRVLSERMIVGITSASSEEGIPPEDWPDVDSALDKFNAMLLADSTSTPVDVEMQELRASLGLPGK